MNGIGISTGVVLAVAGLALPGTTAADHAGRARDGVLASRAPTVRLESTGAGKILTDRSGFTLYMFTRDGRDRDNCRRIAGCLAVWPALTTTRRPVAGPHLRSSMLGAITLHGSIKQVTYNGHPLYTYALDLKPRAVLYVGAYEYGGLWDAVTATGRPTS